MRGAEPTAINWKTAHGDDLVSRRFLHEPSGSSDKCEPGPKKLPVGSKAYNLGRSLSPKTKTGLSPPACFFPQFCQDSAARDPEVFMGPSIRLEIVQHVMFLKASLCKSLRRFCSHRPSKQQITEPALTEKLLVLSHPWDHTLCPSWKKLLRALGK